jgi:hypothetical protein
MQNLICTVYVSHNKGVLWYTRGYIPDRQGAEKSFWTLPIFESTAAADRDVFWKIDRVLRFFPLGVFIGEGAMSEVDPGALTPWRRGQGLGRASLVCGPPVDTLLLLFG